MSFVERMELRFLLGFKRMAAELSVEFPNVEVDVYSFPIGSLTSWQGHDIAIGCVFTDGRPRPDDVALSIGFHHLTTLSKFEADVVWGHPSGYVEAEFPGKPIEVSDDALDQLETELPRLYEALREAIRRGYPSE